MPTQEVSIDQRLLDPLKDLMDVPEAVHKALKYYLVNQITNKISSLAQTDNHFKEKYGMGFADFSCKLQQEEGFVDYLENSLQQKNWEDDYIEWEFCHKGIEDWSNKLKHILMI